MKIEVGGERADGAEGKGDGIDLTRSAVAQLISYAEHDMHQIDRSGDGGEESDPPLDSLVPFIPHRPHHPTSLSQGRPSKKTCIWLLPACLFVAEKYIHYYLLSNTQQ